MRTQGARGLRPYRNRYEECPVSFLATREPSGRPLLLLAHTDPVYAAVARRYFRQSGWDVVVARTPLEVRRLARQVSATIVVLDTEFRVESGWLTCAKLTDEHPYLTVILSTPHPTARARRLASFVGASDVVDQQAGVSSLVDAVFTAALRAVG